MALIFHLSSELEPMPEVTTYFWDKLLHTVEYGGLAMLFCRALTGEGLTWLVAAVVAIGLTSVYGVTDEYHQLFVPLRSPDIHDWMADTLGAGIGAVAYIVALIWHRRPDGSA